MIPDASVMDHKTPQGAFRSSALLRAGAASRMNHRVAAGTCGKKRSDGRGKEAGRGGRGGGNDLCVLYY